MAEGSKALLQRHESWVRSPVIAMPSSTVEMREREREREWDQTELNIEVQSHCDQI